MKLLALASLLTVTLITACQPDISANNQAKSATEVTTQETKAPMNDVYVTAIKTDSNEGNAAAARGVLNIKNDCLFIDDMLVVISTPYLHWKQNPFVITNQVNGIEFKIGDIVEVGGSSSPATTLATLNDAPNQWQNPPKSSCQADKIWLTHNIDVVSS